MSGAQKCGIKRAMRYGLARADEKYNLSSAPVTPYRLLFCYLCQLCLFGQLFVIRPNRKPYSSENLGAIFPKPCSAPCVLLHMFWFFGVATVSIALTSITFNFRIIFSGIDIT